MGRVIDKQEMKHSASFSETPELSRVGTGLRSFQAGRRRVWRGGHPACEPASSEAPGRRRAPHTALGSEVRHLTSLAVKVKELVTTNGFSRVFCLQMAF